MGFGMGAARAAAREEAFMDELQAVQQQGTEAERAIDANFVEASQEDLKQETEENSAMGMQMKSRKLEAPQKTVKTEKAQRVEESVLVRKDEADGLADSFSQRQGNREYHLDKNKLSELAQELGEGLTPETNPEEMIKMLRERLSRPDALRQALLPPDPAEIEKAFEFLLEVTQSKLNKAGEDAKERLRRLQKHLKEVKDKHHSEHASEIEQAEKIIQIADGVISETGKTTNEVLSQMRDIINNPQDVQGKRKYYETNGGYEAMIKDAKGFYHVIGENLKRVKLNTLAPITPSKMPALENSELLRLNDETKTLQAATRVPIQFKLIVKTVEGYLRRRGFLTMGKDLFRAHVNFETLSKLFFDLAEERYPSADKILQLTTRLVDLLHEEEMEKLSTLIAILGAIRDLIKQVAPNKIYRSFQHRDDLYLAIIEALEDLEDQEEELEEQYTEDEEESNQGG